MGIREGVMGGGGRGRGGGLKMLCTRKGVRGRIAVVRWGSRTAEICSRQSANVVGEVCASSSKNDSPEQRFMLVEVVTLHDLS